MAGLVYLADFHDWNAQQATEAYMFHTDVQFALNVEPGVQICTRTFDRYQKFFLEDDLARQIFENVTEVLIEKLELDVSRQRLDSTHVFSHMATFGRTKLMAVAIKRFLVQVKRHNPEAYAALPEALRLRYELAQSQLFGDATDAEKRQRSRQQAAEDLLWVIEHFADQPTMTGRQSYKALLTIFSQQCEVVEGKVMVRGTRPAATACRTHPTPRPPMTGTKALVTVGDKGTRTSLEWGSVARDSGLKTVAARSQPGIRNPNSTAPRT